MLIQLIRFPMHTQKRVSKTIYIWACIVLLAISICGCLAAYHPARNESRRATHTEMMASLANGTAWIWPNSNGPEDMHVGTAPYRQAAVLMESLVLRANTVEYGGRPQPLALASGVRVIPVIHIEAAADATATFTSAQRDAILAAVRRQTDIAATGAGMLQVDFEAPVRELAAYRELIANVRNALPANVRLSVTALTHWCFQGDWLDRLPVDEVVPMVYRLGPHADYWLRRLAQQNTDAAYRCRGPSLGFATNDPPPLTLLIRAVHPYWFDEAAWSNPSLPPRDLAQ